MTQALLNNMNNMNETVSLDGAKIGSAQTGWTDNSDFQQVLDAKNNVLSTDSSQSTIGDIKNSTVANDETNKFSELKKIIDQAFEETNEESALNLTLARDVNDVISQLKGEFGEQVSPEDSSKIEEETEEMTETPMVFEQVMAGLDKTLDYVQVQEYTGLPREAQVVFDEVQTATNGVQTLMDECQTSITDEGQMLTDEVIELVSETVSEDNSTQETASSSESLEDILDEDILKELKIESVEAESNSGDFQDDSLLSKQTIEEHAIKAMINQDSATFELNIDKALKAQDVQSQTKPAEVNPSKIIEQITKQMDGLYSNSKVNIVLNPESLGKVNIQLMNSKEGLTAQFTVTTQEAKDLLMKGIDGLKETLATHGVGVDNVSVKLSDTQKSDNSQDWTEQDGSRGGNKGQGHPNREEKEKGLFEKMMAQTSEKENGNV